MIQILVTQLLLAFDSLRTQNSSLLIFSITEGFIKPFIPPFVFFLDPKFFLKEKIFNVYCNQICLNELLYIYSMSSKIFLFEV